MSYDFDKIVDRSGTDDLKHALLQMLFGRTDVIPLWVADMDWETPHFITDVLRKRIDHSLFGYTVEPENYWETIAQWIKTHHGWEVKPEWMTYIPGIVKGIGMAVNVFMEHDEKVIIQSPVYHHFFLTPKGNGREVVFNPLVRRSDGYYDMDFEGLRALAKDPKCRMLILANPHNPAGLVWSPEILAELAEICYDNDIIVLSDEIHCDMALFGYRHTPFATVSEKAAQCSITFAAPSKTFNIAGLVSSYAIVINEKLRNKYYQWLSANELNEPSLFSPIATMAAYNEGEPWRLEMLRYLENNILFVEEFCAREIPQIKPLRPQASFLVWLDCRGLGLAHDALNDLFVNGARLALNDGEMFGPGGEGFMRLNAATPRSVLQKALTQLQVAVNETTSA